MTGRPGSRHEIGAVARGSMRPGLRPCTAGILPASVYRFASRAGFTSVDLLGVVAIAAIAAAILLPATARNREGERAAACLSNLKLLGYAISMYVPDNQGYLPGPTHLSLPWNARALYSNGGPSAEAWLRLQLTSYLRPYLCAHGMDTGPAGVLPFCPTADGIAVAGSQGQSSIYAARYYYVANSVTACGPMPQVSFEVLQTSPRVRPYYATKPGAYFGSINAGQDIRYVPLENMPKRLDSIANAAMEWAIADLWYWQAAVPRGTTSRVGTWPFALASGSSGSISNNGQLKIPSYPFHLTTKTFSPVGTDHSTGSPRLTTGRTNALFFDAHGDSVRNWLGSVNPCFNDGSHQCR